SWPLPACGCSEKVRSPFGLLRENNARTGGADFDVDADSLLHARRRPEAPPGEGVRLPCSHQLIHGVGRGGCFFHIRA
uniref:Uncharacterized protein n=1 Tax=Oryza meridionalis TaxID=40149 RepID=A0A0E0F9R3_9ORYZ